MKSAYTTRPARPNDSHMTQPNRSALPLPLEVGPYRHDMIEETGVRVSTIIRESSAMEYAPNYFETMAFWLDNRPRILWQSAAGFQREADRQHDLAVRWFSREGVAFT